jgi:hypothetical protein
LYLWPFGPFPFPFSSSYPIFIKILLENSN